MYEGDAKRGVCVCVCARAHALVCSTSLLSVFWMNS